MKMAINLKKIVPLMVLFALIVGVLNLGSYDPRNEMSVLSPNIASATWWGNNDDCEIWTADQELYVGSDAVLEWWVEDGYNNITINGESVSGNSHTFKNLQNDTTFKLVAINDEGEKCTSKVKIECLPVPPPVCTFSPEWTTVYSGESATLEWTSTNAVSAFISGGIGEVSVNGSYDTGPLYEDKWYTLTVTNSEGETVECMSDIEVKPQPTVPTCDSFIADPSSIFRGSSTDLVWSTSNATRVVIDNAIGEASLDNRFSVTPLQSTLYTLTAFGEDGQQAVCTAEVTVKEPPVENVPQCLSFTASTSNLSAGGGDSTLEWTTSNATNVTIEPGIGNVDLNGSRLVNLTENTTYTLTASDNNSEDTCSTTITIEEPEPEPSSITCEANVDFSSSPKSLTKGESATLSWSTTDITEISFDNNIVATGLSGSVSVTPDVSTSYLLTATDGVDTISCPVTVSVSEPPRTTGGGGGGGSSSPKCELSISDSKIERGEEIELTWDSTRAGEVIIVDSDGETIITTEDLLGSKKDELYDGSITLFPTKDTTYTMTVERGSRDRVCEVDVEVNDDIVVTQIREQQPLIAGISLTEVPYTGFEAGPILTVMFYALLIVWALYVAYLFVIHRRIIGDFKFSVSGVSAKNDFTPVSTNSNVGSTKNEPELATTNVDVPGNLPTGTIDTNVQSVVNTQNLSDVDATEIENYAHTKNALLSSDAIRHFVGTTKSADRNTSLDQVIETAKAKYPIEDGWIVINEQRMREVCADCVFGQVNSDSEPFKPTVVPEGSGSLAEAIVLGNVVAAYELVGQRPMFALADAASDLDSVYRLRKGGNDEVSDLLKSETAKFTNEQIHEMINALTSALDGTYTDEAEAVKMAIMKAVKVATHS